ncbi:MAG: BMC domain-containing protein [Trichocoleus desertorum ATA4-8-CV12]|jgi:carbon dioxide concentrating mechanism protein CcmO|nr:BMC domain-containing protein [Trichocoleus desertorum ATA4-8-CV12]
MMTPPNNSPTSERLRRIQSLKESALGLVSTRSFPAIVGTADMMLKSAGVTLIGYEKTGGGYCTAVVRGRIADVRLAVEMGAETAEKFGELVSAVIIPRPLPNLEAVLPIGTRLAELALENSQSRLSNLAVGLLETRGFPAMVGAADAMLKSADVQLAAYEKTGAGLCTAIIRGSVADVVIAVEIGMQEAERIGELHAVMVIPRPLDDLEATLPTAACWIEKKPDPLPILISIPVQEEEKELVELERSTVQPLALPAQVAEPELLELPDLQKLPKRLEEL